MVSTMHDIMLSTIAKQKIITLVTHVVVVVVVLIVNIFKYFFSSKVLHNIINYILFLDCIFGTKTDMTKYK